MIRGKNLPSRTTLRTELYRDCVEVDLRLLIEVFITRHDKVEVFHGWGAWCHCSRETRGKRMQKVRSQGRQVVLEGQQLLPDELMIEGKWGLRYRAAYGRKAGPLQKEDFMLRLKMERNFDSVEREMFMKEKGRNRQKRLGYLSSRGRLRNKRVSKMSKIHLKRP